MPTIQNRDRKQVQKPDGRRQKCDKPNEALPPLAGHRAGCLGNTYGAVQVTRADRAGDNLFKPVQTAGDDTPC